MLRQSRGVRLRPGEVLRHAFRNRCELLVASPGEVRQADNVQRGAWDFQLELFAVPTLVVRAPDVDGLGLRDARELEEEVARDLPGSENELGPMVLD